MATTMAYYQQQQPEQRPGRPRTKSMLSFNSNKSATSGGKKEKMDLTETPKEKAHRRINSKNDPNMAIKELQPVQAAFEENTIDSLRGIQHKDRYGNLITDPDRSNPTRPRMERPLDTIRSFEAAIDGSYNKRSSTMMRPISRDGYQSRRSSYHQGWGNPNSHYHGSNYAPSSSGGYDGRYGSGGRGGGYGGSYHRAESYTDGWNHNLPRPPPHGGERRMMGARNHSDPMLYGQGNSQQQQQQYTHPALANQQYNRAPSGSHGYQQSYDTATSSGQSNGTGTASDPWGNSTDPSSENSSLDRIPGVQANKGPPHHHPLPPPPPSKPDLGEQYGLTGFGEFRGNSGPIMEEGGGGADGQYGSGPAYGEESGNLQNGYGFGAPGGLNRNPRMNGAGANGMEGGSYVQAQRSNGANAGAGEMPPPPPPPHKTLSGKLQRRSTRDDSGPPTAGRRYQQQIQQQLMLQNQQQPTPQQEKRKSWLKRTFSKN